MNAPKFHPFHGKTIYVATLHGKEEIFRSIFSALNLQCEAAPIDTDEFGTFSGEVARKGTVREILREKIDAAALRYPHSQLILASEGSFGPEPLNGNFPTDLESLLLWDREFECEIFAEHVSQQVVHAERVVGPKDDFRLFLKDVHFPSHGIMVHPEGSLTPIAKGLHNERAVAQAMLDAFCASKTARVVLRTDLRACHNPTRRKAILAAGRKLAESLRTLCAVCSYPGFSITEVVPGLPYADCGAPNLAAKTVVFTCPKCKYREERGRPDGLTSVEPSNCNHCNP